MGSDLPRGHEARHFHILDVTVKPHRSRTGVRRWTPGDLALVAPGALPARPEEDEEVGRIFGAERWHRDRFVAAGDPGGSARRCQRFCGAFNKGLISALAPSTASPKPRTGSSIHSALLENR